MGWVMLENGEGVGLGMGRVRQVLWNRAAANIGLEGITVTMRYGEKKDGGSGGLNGECALLWKDRLIEGGLPNVEAKEDAQ